ncbi:unnamed protein product, partial [Didymodactylos carnosus]
LQNVVLESKNNKNEDLLNKFIFQILEKYFYFNKNNNDLSQQQFLTDYYLKFKKRIINLEEQKESFEEQLKLLDKFICSISQWNNNLEKFHLLSALNNIFFNRQNIDVTIFNKFDQCEWRKEILCSELLAGIFKSIYYQQQQKEENGVNEFELEIFRKNINKLGKIYTIENLLQILIDKQNIYQFDLEFVNDILFMLLQLDNDEDDQIKVFNILQLENNQSFFLQLQELWLNKRLKYFHIEFIDENLKILNQYLPYRSKIINQILERTTENTTIEELITFFITLTNCGLTQKSNEYFLENEIKHKTNIKNWNLKLADRLIGVFLTKKYSFYNNYLQNNNSYKLVSTKTSVFKQNAYNQVNTTYPYSADDIAQISSELMKDFTDKFRIIQPLNQHHEKDGDDDDDDRNCFEILTQILIEYKQDQRTTLIPLNISDNHWIVLTLIRHKNKDVILYKDSLGEDDDIEKREEIQNILNEKLENIDFKFHKSCDQYDNYNSGIFVLANMEFIAKQLMNDKNNFIKNFEKYSFVSEEKAVELRRETFPKMYALNLCQTYKKRKIINHHLSELKIVQKLFEENNNNNVILVDCPIVIGSENKIEKNGLRLSVDFPREENLLKKDYQYLYVIEASSSKNINFNYDHEFKKQICTILGIKRIYSTEKNSIKILDQDLKVILNQKQQEKKLDQTELKITSDNEYEKLLNELCVNVNEFNKEILKRNLNLSSSIENSNNNNNDDIIDVKDYKLLNNLHKKFIKILISGWSIE